MIKLNLPFRKKPEEKKPTSVLGLRRLKEKKSPKISRKKILTGFLILGLVLLVYSIFFIVKKNPFSIQNIKFKNSDLSCVSNEQLKSFLNISKYNLFSIDTTKLEQQAKNKFVCIQTISIVKKFPSLLEVSANDRKSAVVIRVFQLPQLNLKIEDATSSTQAAILTDNVSNASPGGNFIVDDQGVVIYAEEGQSGLPIIDYYNQEKELKVGSRLPANLINKTLQILDGLAKLGLEIKSVKIINSSLFITQENQPVATPFKNSPSTEYIFSLNKESDRQLATLQLILHQATMDSKPIQKIDLRFDKVVVVYSVPSR